MQGDLEAEVKRFRGRITERFSGDLDSRNIDVLVAAFQEEWKNYQGDEIVQAARKGESAFVLLWADHFDLGAINWKFHFELDQKKLSELKTQLLNLTRNSPTHPACHGAIIDLKDVIVPTPQSGTSASWVDR